MYDAICEAFHRELEAMDEKYAGGAALNHQDLEEIDKIVHALKSMATYEAMTGEPYTWKRTRPREYRRY